MNLSGLSGHVRLMAGDVCLIDRLYVARSLRTRTLGLMFRRGVPEAYGKGLLFPDCASLHTFHMRFPLDVVFLDRDGQPLKLLKTVSPWRVVKGPRGTRHFLEVRSGFWSDGLPSGKWSLVPLPDQETP